ncbi:MAG TPA: DUF1080 domain-containing protein [Pirellulaceae bacterium]|nr:DUF1080 domain-containing protein [Pirellulaceae bacterium]
MGYLAAADSGGLPCASELHRQNLWLIFWLAKMNQLICVIVSAALCIPQDTETEWLSLFKEDGIPTGWRVTDWSDVGLAVQDADWQVTNGVLRPGERRGTWLISEREFGDFTLEFEIKLTELGNSGVALRSPLKGDPAFDGLEFQIADERYNPEAKDSELTGGLYRAAAPSKQVYRPTEWNSVRLELRGTRFCAWLNGEMIQDIDLRTYDQPVPRHDGTLAPPLNQRPLRGHIGFQHLSRDGPVEIRNLRIKELQ